MEAVSLHSIHLMTNNLAWGLTGNEMKTASNRSTALFSRIPDDVAILDLQLGTYHYEFDL